MPRRRHRSLEEVAEVKWRVVAAVVGGSADAAAVARTVATAAAETRRTWLRGPSSDAAKAHAGYHIPGAHCPSSYRSCP